MMKYMKILLCLLLACVMLVGCVEELEADPEVYLREILNAMSEEDIDRAAELMHPSAGDVEDKMKGLSHYVAGKKVTELSLVPVESTESGKVHKETAGERNTFDVVLDDGTTFKVVCVFLDDDSGTGFLQIYFTFGS
ncbi:MAG: hypothetical protein IJW45_06850 [Oscillospiraceae bacterium]|nr:hypothetical protein [Oscillospiraceae bacterium]